MNVSKPPAPPAPRPIDPSPHTSMRPVGDPDLDTPRPTLGRIVLVQLATRDAPFPAIVTGLPGPGPYAIDCEVFGTDNGSQVMLAVGHDPSGHVLGTWHWPPRV